MVIFFGRGKTSLLWSTAKSLKKHFFKIWLYILKLGVIKEHLGINKKLSAN